ncbi:MAG: hypothetical protein AAF581_22400 [Planctomycetota bacterium]
MSKCDLRVVLDGKQTRHSAGAMVRGVVLVEVNAECQCNGLTVAPQWRTHGRGNRTNGGPKPDGVLFAGTWAPGSYEYPFELRLPNGPITYHGHYLNVDWVIHARADIPWAIDPKGGTEIVLERGNYDGRLAPGDLTSVDSVRESRSRSDWSGCALLFVVPFLLIGLGTIWNGIVTLINGQMMGLALLAFGVVFAAAALIFASITLRAKVAERRLGPVEVVLDPTLTRPGQNVRCTVRFTPQADIEVAGVTARLTGRERVVSGSGTDRTTYTHEIHSATEQLLGQDHIFAGNAVELSADLAIPEDAAPTFVASSNRLEWVVTVHIDLPRWLDWSRTDKVIVS